MVIHKIEIPIEGMLSVVSSHQSENSSFEGAGGEGEYSPKITVRTKKKDSSLTIEDNGLGILDEIKDKILHPFFTTKKGTAGTGLGLSITHDIVKAHGGSLDIDTIQGESTTFTIRLEKRGENGF